MNHDHHHHNQTHHHPDASGGGFEVALKGKKEVAEGNMAFVFEKPQGFSFRAGQHLNMKLINPPETDDEGSSRHFSLANSPAEKELLFATRMRNTAFKRVLGSMNPESKVIVEHIHGSFTLHNDESKPAVFLIGGIGITPVFSIIKDVAERKLPHQLFLFYSNKQPEDAPFLKELEELAKQNPNFKLIPTMTELHESKETWQGETGYIDRTMLERYLDNFQTLIYYLAGPPVMVTAMRKLLNGLSISKNNIITEEFKGY